MQIFFIGNLLSFISRNGCRAQNGIILLCLIVGQGIIFTSYQAEAQITCKAAYRTGGIVTKGLLSRIEANGIAVKDLNIDILYKHPMNDDLGMDIILYLGKKKIGSMDLAPLGETDKKEYLEAHSKLAKRYHGQGLGALMYILAGMVVKEEGKTLVSSQAPSNQAQNIWQRFEQEGAAKRKTVVVEKLEYRNIREDRWIINMDTLEGNDPALFQFLDQMIKKQDQKN